MLHRKTRLSIKKKILTEKDFEIMAPVDSYEALAAAIQGRADSICFGIEGLNNFTTEDLCKIVTLCKEHNMKSYLNVNTEIYEEDLSLMREIIEAAKEAVQTYSSATHCTDKVKDCDKQLAATFNPTLRNNDHRKQGLGTSLHGLSATKEKGKLTTGINKKEKEEQLQKRMIILLTVSCIFMVLATFLIIRWKDLFLSQSHKQKKNIGLQKSEFKLKKQSYFEKETIKRNQDELVEKVALLIKKHLVAYPEEKAKYLEKLHYIDRKTILRLKNKKISNLRIQYCICFGIGMKKEHISICYNIADQTIRKHKSTIKSELELEKKDNLDLYLFDLFLLNQY